MLEVRHQSRDLGEQFPREEAKRTTGLGQAIASLSVKVHTPLRSLERSYAPRQQARHDASQRIARP